MGRVCVDLYPVQLEDPLEDVEGFHKYVGGFAGNVATGLARLGVTRAIVSAVGDDGHGRFVRRFLESEGVDCRWLTASTPPCARRSHSVRLAARQLPDHLLPNPDLPRLGAERGSSRPGGHRGRSARLRQRHRHSRASRRGWRRSPRSRRGPAGPGHHHSRPRLATDVVERPGRLRGLHAQSPRGWPTLSWAPDEEITAAVVGQRPGARCSRWAQPSSHRSTAPMESPCTRPTERPPGWTAHPVEVVNGLGAGDAFAAAFGWRLLRGDDPATAGRISATGPAPMSPAGWAARWQCRRKETCCDRSDAARSGAAGHARRGRLALAVLPVGRVAGAGVARHGDDEVCLVNIGGQLVGQRSTAPAQPRRPRAPFAALPRRSTCRPARATTVEGEGRWRAARLGRPEPPSGAADSDPSRRCGSRCAARATPPARSTTSSRPSSRPIGCWWSRC